MSSFVALPSHWTKLLRHIWFVASRRRGQPVEFFAELMAALGSRDGREIVRAFDALRAEGLRRDERGRYLMDAETKTDAR